MKATAVAPSNIAFTKYWGKKDESLRIPLNSSVSVNLSNLLTTTTVEFSPDYEKDVIVYNSLQRKGERSEKRVIEHVDRVRKLSRLKEKVRIVTVTNFPSAAGLASSASGFAALTVAASSAAGLQLSEKKLSILARLGSGSACRSIPDGFVEWLDGRTNERSYAVSIFPPSYWNLSITAVIISKEQKGISSTLGQQLLVSNTFLPVRLARMKEKNRLVKKYITQKRFTQFGELVEMEALELHAMTLTSSPPIIYWQPDTVKMMKLVQTWRKEGLEVYFTIDAGPNIFLICEEKNQQKLIKKLIKNNLKDFIVNKPSAGARLISRHLF